MSRFISNWLVKLPSKGPPKLSPLLFLHKNIQKHFKSPCRNFFQCSYCSLTQWKISNFIGNSRRLLSKGNSELIFWAEKELPHISADSEKICIKHLVMQNFLATLLRWDSLIRNILCYFFLSKSIIWLVRPCWFHVTWFWFPFLCRKLKNNVNNGPNLSTKPRMSN